MKRRNFLKSSALISLVHPFNITNVSQHSCESIRIYSLNSSDLITKISISNYHGNLKIMQISDLHFSDSEIDELGFDMYSRRMNNAYKRVKHYASNEETTTIELFDEMLKQAIDQNVELLFLTGDIFNYPSKPAVALILEKLKMTNIPFYYTSGNHDWHYEGMEGSLEELREQWINHALKPLYGNKNPYFYATVKNGINMVVIDNSTYQVSKSQYEFFLKERRKELPIILFVHIPIYMTSLNVSSCGHPDWGALTDTNFEIERRVKWSENGNTIWTKNFVESVKSSTNLLCVFAGHHHENRVMYEQNIHQVVALPAFRGYSRIIEISG